MNEGQFLKEHPSLKGKVFVICEGGERNNCHIGDIHETQIDKAKVNAAIKKVEEYSVFDAPEVKAEMFARRLKKELGLE